MDNDNDNELLTTREAAKLIQTTAAYVSLLCREGKLVCSKHRGIRWLIPSASVEDYIARRSGPAPGPAPVAGPTSPEDEPPDCGGEVSAALDGHIKETVSNVTLQDAMGIFLSLTKTGRFAEAISVVIHLPEDVLLAFSRSCKIRVIAFLQEPSEEHIRTSLTNTEWLVKTTGQLDQLLLLERSKRREEASARYTNEKPKETDGFWERQVALDCIAELRSIFENSGITRSELAKKMDVSAAWVSQFFSSSNVTISTLCKFAAAIGYTPSISFVPVIQREKRRRRIRLNDLEAPNGVN